MSRSPSIETKNFKITLHSMNRSRLLLDVTSEFPWTCPSARLPRERGNKRQIHTLALSGARSDPELPPEFKVEISNGNTSRIDSFAASTLEWFIRIRFINYAGAFSRENDSKSEREMEWGFSLVWNLFRLFHRKRKKFAERAEKFFFLHFLGHWFQCGRNFKTIERCEF